MILKFLKNLSRGFPFKIILFIKKGNIMGQGRILGGFIRTNNGNIMGIGKGKIMGNIFKDN